MKVVLAFSIAEWARTEHHVDPAELERNVAKQRTTVLPERQPWSE